MLKENDMAENRSSVSKKKTYKEIGEYWDSHEIPEGSKEVMFSVELDSDIHYLALENSLSARLRSIAEKRGVSTETLVNLWLQEKANQEVAAS